MEKEFVNKLGDEVQSSLQMKSEDSKSSLVSTKQMIKDCCD